MWIGFFAIFLASFISVVSLTTESVVNVSRDGLQHISSAQRFIVYKNRLMLKEEQDGPLDLGVFPNDQLESGYLLDMDFSDFKSLVTDTGWTMAWTTAEGASYHNVLTASDYSNSLCIVESDNRCMSPRSSDPLIPSTDMPTALPVGAVVYAWRSMQ